MQSRRLRHCQSSRFGQLLKLFLGSADAISSTATLSLTSKSVALVRHRAGAEALLGQLLCNLVDYDIVKSSRFGQVLMLFLGSFYAISSTATWALTSSRVVSSLSPNGDA